MTIKVDRVSVGTTATRLDTQPNTGNYNGDSISIQNLGTASVYIGGSAVTTSSYGYELKSNSSIALDVRIDDTIFGIVSSGTITVNVLTVGA
jgi:hypothetical protein